MAVRAAAVEGSTGQSPPWNSGLRPLDAGKRRHFSFTNLPDDGHDIQAGGRDNRRQQAEESLKKVMYLNCWAQS